MRDFLPFVVIGVTTGSLYALAATGLVLTYKTSGILNFAQGAVAAVCAYAFYELRSVRGLPWAVALTFTVAVLAPAVGLLLELVARRVSQADTATRIVATIGLLVGLQGLTQRLYGETPLPFPPFLSTETFRVAGVNVGIDQLVTVLVALGCLGALIVFFRTSKLGLAMRAVADDPSLLDLTGQDPVRVRRAAWAIGCAFSALSGVLLAAIVGLDIAFLTLLVVQAFGAAAVGRFRNLGVTFAAAVTIAVVGEVIKKYVPDQPALAGLAPSLPFLVLFGVLVLSPPGRFRERESRRRPYRPVRVPPRLGLVIGIVVMAAVVVTPELAGSRLPVYTNGAIYVVLFVSLGLLVQLSGQVSLCQLSFAAVGATTFSRLTTDLGMPWLVACLLAGLVVVPLGALLAIPAIRLSSLYLALATFGFAILLERLVFGTFLMFGAGATREAARPHVLGLDGERGFFYLCAFAAAASVALALLIGRTRLGRLLRGLADSPVALATNGAEPNVTRVLVFCVSAFLAGISGVLLISLTGTAIAGGATFGSYQSLLLLVVLAICGRSLVVAPVLAAFLVAVAPAYSTSPDYATTQQLSFGLLAVVIAAAGPAVTQLVGRAGPRSDWRRLSSPVRARNARHLAAAVEAHA